MTTKEIITALQSRRKIEAYEAIRQGLFYRLYMDGLSGNDLANLFDMSKRNIYHGVYNFRDKFGIKDAKCLEAAAELDRHAIVVTPIIKKYKCAGYTLTVDGEDCLKTKE